MSPLEAWSVDACAELDLPPPRRIWFWQADQYMECGHTITQTTFGHVLDWPEAIVDAIWPIAYGGAQQ